MIYHALAGIIGTAVGATLEYFFGWYREKRKMALLRFSGPYFHPFERSIHVLLEVKHDEGELPASNAVPFLTIKYGDREGIPSQLLVIKGKGAPSEYTHVVSCLSPRSVDYLAPIKYVFRDGAWKLNVETVIVRSDALPWTLPVYIGKGLEGYEYKHVTHIPVKGSGKVALFDIYKYEHEGKKYFLLRVHSEYGTDVKPRILLKLPTEQGLKDELKFEVTICAENLKRSTMAKVVVKYVEMARYYLLEYYVDKNLVESFSFKEITKDIEELKPKGIHY